MVHETKDEKGKFIINSFCLEPQGQSGDVHVSQPWRWHKLLFPSFHLLFDRRLCPVVVSLVHMTNGVSYKWLVDWWVRQHLLVQEGCDGWVQYSCLQENAIPVPCGTRKQATLAASPIFLHVAMMILPMHLFMLKDLTPFCLRTLLLQCSCLPGLPETSYLLLNMCSDRKLYFRKL